MYTLFASEYFRKQFKKHAAKNAELKKRILKSLSLLEEDPFYPSLKSHKVFSKMCGEKWSSWVTGDVRIIWNFDGKDIRVIELFDLGGHSGGSGVY